MDLLIQLACLDEPEITTDALLRDDLGLDELDIVELAMALDIDDDEVVDEERGWFRVRDVVRSYARAQRASA